MQLALEDAKLKPGEIDCIFANANSTKDADLGETLAIKGVFGNYAYKVPVVGIKSMLGESLSASGGLATVAALGALEQGIIPATINYQQKDSDCDLDYVPNKPRKCQVDVAMNESFGFGGQNDVVIIKRFS